MRSPEAFIEILYQDRENIMIFWDIKVLYYGEITIPKAVLHRRPGFTDRFAVFKVSPAKRQTKSFSGHRYLGQRYR
jgi:hypothetical protein